MQEAVPTAHIRGWDCGLRQLMLSTLGPPKVTYSDFCAGSLPMLWNIVQMTQEARSDSCVHLFK